jgi:hypothetical protein
VVNLSEKEKFFFLFAAIRENEVWQLFFEKWSLHVRENREQQ